MTMDEKESQEQICSFTFVNFYFALAFVKEITLFLIGVNGVSPFPL